MSDALREHGATTNICLVAVKCRSLSLRTLSSQLQQAHTPTEIDEDYQKNGFYGEFNALISKVSTQQAVIVGIDANAKMELKQQSNVLGKWYYTVEQTSVNENSLEDLCGQMRQGTTSLPSDERHKSKMSTLKLQFDRGLSLEYLPVSDTRKSKAAGTSYSISITAHFSSA
ncbi:hypothetical protein RB195_000669 [Necator americanus]|uniref:Uncharacterized protein n=1 Tax=Necator americanus TaxID=51031 RepID=A0ABR1DAT9_NECAM